MEDYGGQPGGEALTRAFHVIGLLGELRTPRAIGLLEKTLEREELASYVVETLSRTDVPQSVDILRRAASRKNLAPAAEEALTRLAVLSGDPLIVELAKASLAGLVKEEPEARRSRRPRDDESGAWRQTGERYTPPEGSDEAPFYRHTSSALLPPIALLSDLLKKGRIVPFIGAGVLSVMREAGQTWRESSEYLPTPSELSDYLAKRTQYPEADTGNLTKVAQYFRTVAGRDPLERELRRVFDRDYPITTLHHFLASRRVPLLIVTTNYDDLMERAMEEHNQPYELVIHTTDPFIGDQVLWKPHDHEPRLVRPNQLDVDPSVRTVIYKIHGAVDRQRQDRDQYVITEDDYIDFLTRMAKSTAIPAVLAEALQTRPLLFLGYGLRDWNLRVVLSRLRKDLRLDRESAVSWAIQSNPTPLELQFWERSYVRVYDMSLDEFVELLTKDDLS